MVILYVLQRRLKAAIREQAGSAFVLMSLSMIGLLAMTGIVVDMGTLYVTKTELQKAANAAVLSGAQELTYEESAVRDVVNTILQEHDKTDSLAGLEIKMEERVDIILERSVKLQFSGLIGRNQSVVKVHAAAELRSMGKASGAAPLGIDESIELIHYQPYRLKVDEQDVDTGNFGILALGGAGANTYEDNLKNGYSEDIKIGDILPTQTGNIAGKTREGVQERINSCPYPVEETHHRDCPRVILIPVYQPYEHDQNQLQQVKVTGFAYFYITDPMDQHDKTVNGMFIKRAGTGTASDGALDKGAYVIRLTE